MPLITIVNLTAEDQVITDNKKSFPPITVKASATLSNFPILGVNLERMGPVLARMVTASTITFTTAQDPAIDDAAENLMGPAAISDAAVTPIKLSSALLGPRRVRTATTANLASFVGVSTSLNGLTLVQNDRVLVCAQTVAAENGIYLVGVVGGGIATWTRATDMAAAAIVPNGLLIVVDAGTTVANRIYKLTNAGTITVATTGLTFERVLTNTQEDTGNEWPSLAPTRTVRAATSANIASFASVSTTLDGLTLVQNDRVLVKNQTSAAENGIYVVGVVGGGNAPWTRALDMPATAIIPNGTMISVDAGTLAADTIHRITNAGVITIATTGLVFECFSITKVGLTPKLVVAAKSANAWQVVGSIVDDAGVVQASARDVLIETMAVTADKGDLAAAGSAVGTVNVSFNPATGINAQDMTTTAGGLFSFSITDSATETVLCRVSGPGLKTLLVTVGPT